jgi:hypothetical protein
MSEDKSIAPYIFDFVVIFGLGLVASWVLRTDPLELGRWKLALVAVIWLLGLGYYLLRQKARRNA